MFSWGGEGGQCLSAPPLLPIYSAAFRSSGLDVDMVADKEVDRWPTSTWWLTIKKTLTLTLTWKSNLVSEFVHGGWLIGPKLCRPEAFTACASSKLCKFIYVKVRRSPRLGDHNHKRFDDRQSSAALKSLHSGDQIFQGPLVRLIYDMVETCEPSFELYVPCGFCHFVNDIFCLKLVPPALTLHQTSRLPPGQTQYCFALVHNFRLKVTIT